MRIGKISETVLKRSVLKNCPDVRPLLQGAKAGRGSALIAAQEGPMACASAQAAVCQRIHVRFVLEHTMNNLVCSGCLPQYAQLQLMLPPDAEEDTLRGIMEEAAQTCGRQKVQITGGHTEVTPAVHTPVLAVTVFGFCGEKPLTADAIRSGMALLMAGCAGLEGTALLAREQETALKKRFPMDLVLQAQAFQENVSIVLAAARAAELGAAALHAASQGGIFGALWEFCESAGLGLEADLRRIPIRQETIEICEFLGKNPYCLLSGGALLIAAADGEKMQQELRRAGISAEMIGAFQAGNDRVLRNGEEIRFLERPAQDEIWKGIETEWQK